MRLSSNLEIRTFGAIGAEVKGVNLARVSDAEVAATLLALRGNPFSLNIIAIFLLVLQFTSFVQFANI